MESDSAYRQGTVLGLTIAEMFILLLFLLLIAFWGFSDQWQKEKEELSASEQRLYEWHNKWEGTLEGHTPTEIETLIREAPRSDEQREATDNWRKKNEELQKEKEQLQRERETLEKQAEELDKLRKENKELQAEKEQWQREQETLKEQTEEAKQEATQAKKALQKGQNPPCWYEVVKIKEGTREKPHYLFNVAVHDDYMIVQRPKPPLGQADDDNNKGLTYAEEAELLPLDDIPYDEPLTDKQLDQYMHRIHDMGKNKEVRSYSCIFYVKVWDKTSVGAKKDWREAYENVLERWFGTYPVKDDPWPVSP